MSVRMPENVRQKRYAHYATNSPLKPTKDDIVHASDRATIPEKRVRHTQRFVLDGARKLPSNMSVLPSYNAYTDRHSKIYFRSPVVQAMFRKADLGAKGNMGSNTDIKLSSRHRIPGTPLDDLLKSKESRYVGVADRLKENLRFVVDSVRVDSLKTKRNPIIPRYDGTNDKHTRNYFKKESVKSLIERTCGLKI